MGRVSRVFLSNDMNERWPGERGESRSILTASLSWFWKAISSTSSSRFILVMSLTASIVDGARRWNNEENGWKHLEILAQATMAAGSRKTRENFSLSGENAFSGCSRKCSPLQERGVAADSRLIASERPHMPASRSIWTNLYMMDLDCISVCYE